MGIWNKSRSFSFDEECDSILEWGKDKFSPRFDEPRSRSLLLRFIVKQWAAYTRVMLSMPEIMEAVVRASQQTNFPKVSQTVLHFPVAAPRTGEGLELSSRDTSLLKFSRRRRAGADAARDWAFYLLPKQKQLARRVAV